MQRKNYHLTDEQIKKLETLKKKTDMSVSEHIRRAVDEYLEKKK